MAVNVRPLAPYVFSGSDSGIYDIYVIPPELSVRIAIALPNIRDIAYLSDADLALARYCLMNPVTAKLIAEIRALRDGTNTAIIDREAADAYAVTSTSMRDLRQDIAALRQSQDDVEAKIDNILAIMNAILSAL